MSMYTSRELELLAKHQRAILLGEYIGSFCLWVGSLFRRLFKRNPT